MSATPISDSTPHNVAELGMLCRTLERLASVRLDYINQLEANNDAANDRIKRLEEAGDRMEKLLPEGSICDKAVNLWREAKEDKL